MTITNLDQATIDVEAVMFFIAGLYFFVKQHHIAAGLCAFVFLAAGQLIK